MQKGQFAKIFHLSPESQVLIFFSRLPSYDVPRYVVSLQTEIQGIRHQSDIIVAQPEMAHDIVSKYTEADAVKFVQKYTDKMNGVREYPITPDKAFPPPIPGNKDQKVEQLSSLKTKSYDELVDFYELQSKDTLLNLQRAMFGDPDLERELKILEVHLNKLYGLEPNNRSGNPGDPRGDNSPLDGYPGGN